MQLGEMKIPISEKHPFGRVNGKQPKKRALPQPDYKDAYQQLLSKYYRAKKKVIQLKIETANDQKRTVMSKVNTPEEPECQESEKPPSQSESSQEEEVSLPQVKEDLLATLASVVRHESLRPVVLSVSSKSPPSKMTPFMARIVNSGYFCDGCGKRMEKRRQLNL